MSRVGKAPIQIPEKVSVTVQGGEVQVKGPLGMLSVGLLDEIDVKVADGQVALARKSEEKEVRSCHGLLRNLIHNMVIGVSEGYKKDLEINGVGYRAEVKDKDLVMTLGFSHPVKFPIPDGIKISVNKQTALTVEGINKQLVGETAARIRQLRPPEPYKGKGIKYAEEVIKRKAGKSAV